MTLIKDDLEIDSEAEPELTRRSDSSPSGLSKGWSERPERRTRVESVKGVLEPPEIVSVEMTDEEQDVYALMGVTPLKKLEKDFKNEKSVIINVVPPGQGGASVEESYSLTPTPYKVNIAEEETVPMDEAAEQVESNQTIDENETLARTADRRRRRRRSSVMEAPST